MATTERYTAKDFVPVVKAEMRQRGWGIRTLARHASKFDGKSVETWRRNIYRWLKQGMKPSLENRQDIAEVLGLPRDTFNINGDDDEEEGPVVDLVRSLKLLVHDAVQAEGEHGARSLRGIYEMGSNKF